MRKIQFLLSFFIIGSILISTRISGQDLNIQALGNSITQANNTRESYRYPLWKKLIDDGFEFQFVGSLTSHFLCGTPPYENHMGHVFNKKHEGHWGWRSYEILNGGGASSACRGTGNLTTWLTNYSPDITLLHLGSNDIFNNDFGLSDDDLVDTTIYYLESIIDALRLKNPYVTIFVAQVIPANPANGSGYRIPLFNADIPQIAVDKFDPNSPIVIVDQFTGFSVAADTYDNIHPNADGEEKMAQRWRDAIFDHYGGFQLDLTVFLEGAYTGAGMSTELDSDIPLSQPFNVEPWNYTGLETVDSIPADVVDWVLIEIRDADAVSLADETTIVGRRAAFLRNDGKIVYLDGTPGIRFVKEITDDLFVVVRHRNHLPVLSANALVLFNGEYAYDFSSAGAHGGNSAMKDIGDGTLVMVAGDMNVDGLINLSDKTLSWDVQTGTGGYLSSDLNLDGKADNVDKNDFWFVNQGFSSQLPQAE
jgi:lysophospholipase L1-like esterase